MALNYSKRIGTGEKYYHMFPSFLSLIYTLKITTLSLEELHHHSFVFDILISLSLSSSIMYWNNN